MANAIEDAESSFKGPSIEPGLYPAVIVGVQGVTSSYEGKTKTGYRLICQYEDDEKQRFHIASKQFDLSLYEKSNFAKMFVAWTGCQNSPKAIMDELEKRGFVDKNKDIKWDNFLGKSCALMLKLETSKKDPEKKYVNLDGFHAPTKKTGKITAEPQELPWFLGEVYGGQVDDSLYMEGFSIGAKKGEQKQSSAAPAEEVSSDEGDDDVPLPF